ncbi:MAG: glycosyltransferase [Sutterellaceae bacterium]|nr:glycosyltransferase family 4 protein [Burkholderiaceae bacterium]MDW8429333.1 glycosyltransferase [Sutterellaceae bacterium]
MKIPFLCYSFPYRPAFRSEVRAYHRLHRWARGHEVELIALRRSREEVQQAHGFSQLGVPYRAVLVDEWMRWTRVGMTLPTLRPASEAFFLSAPMRRAARCTVLARSIDSAVGYCASVGWRVENTERPAVIDVCDVASRRWFDYSAFKSWPLSLPYRRQGMCVARTERRLARRFDAVTVAAHGERDALEQMGIVGCVERFPNGVDAEYFVPQAKDRCDPATIAFVGRMDNFPTAQAVTRFCSEVWPALQGRIPRAKLRIVSAAPTRGVKNLSEHRAGEVTGAVADLRPNVRRSGLTLAPLAIARGARNTRLQAMAMGVPVVASRMAAGGVDAVAGEHLRVAERPEQYRDAILRVLENSAERAPLAATGRARALPHHAWAASRKRLDLIIHRCLHRFAAQPRLHRHTP